MNQITEKAKELKIIINPKKTKITKISRSFIFLQFKYYLTDDGHVVVRINPKTVTRMRRKLKKLKAKYLAGEVRFIKIKSLFQSWIANYSKYMSKEQIKHMVELYQELFGGGLDQWMKGKNII